MPPLTASQQAYAAYFAASRARWRAGVTATTKQIDAIYGNALRQVQADMIRLLPTVPSARHLSQIEGALIQARGQLSQRVLDATLHGISLSVDAATSSAFATANRILGHAYEAGGLAAIYQSVNQRAVLAFATRTRYDGLRLSDRIWKAADKWRGYVTRAVENGVATGQSARALAESLDPYLKTGVAKSSSIGVRRRLGIPKRISYQALRVARTEMATAFKEGTVLGHSRTPSYLGVKWEISAGHSFEDICDELATGGDNNDGIYTAGSEPLQPHPNCMCVLSPIHEPPDQFTDRLKQWIDDPKADPDLERWHNEVAKPFFNGQPITLPQMPARTRVLTGTPRSVRPGLKPAQALSVPRATTAKQAPAIQPAANDDVAEQLEKAAEATRAAEARAAAKAAQDAADKAAREAREAIQRLERRLTDLDDEARRIGAPRVARTVDEATETHLSQLTSAERASQREAIRLKYRDAGVEDFTLEQRITQQELVNATFGEGTQLAKTMNTPMMIGKRPGVVFTKDAVLGNGGTGAGEVFGNNVVMYANKLARATGTNADEIRYHVGRAIYRNGHIASSQQQTFISTFQNVGRSTLEAELGAGIDRAEGLFGAMFRQVTGRKITAAKVKSWPDELLQALDTLEARIPQIPKHAHKLLAQRAKVAEAAAKKAAKEAAKNAGQAFKNIPKIGQPGRAVARAQAEKFAEGSVAPRLIHRSTKTSAQRILKDGVDIEANTTAMYGRGFYTAEGPIGAAYGDWGIEVVLHARNPYVIDMSASAANRNTVNGLIQRYTAANPNDRVSTPVAIQRQALAEGYDAIQVKHGHYEPDYWVVLDLRNVRTIQGSVKDMRGAGW